MANGQNLCCGILKPNLIYISMRESEFLAFQLDDQTPFCLSTKKKYMEREKVHLNFYLF